PFYGSTTDPSCLMRCPDLDLRWYPLADIENPDSILYRLTRSTWCFGPCLSFMLSLIAFFDLKSEWDYFSRRGRIVRLAIMISFVLTLVLAYARLTDMGAWIID